MPKYKIEAFCDSMTLEFECDETDVKEVMYMVETGEIDPEDMVIVHLGDVHIDPDTVQEES